MHEFSALASRNTFSARKTLEEHLISVCVYVFLLTKNRQAGGVDCRACQLSTANKLSPKFIIRNQIWQNPFQASYTFGV